MNIFATVQGMESISHIIARELMQLGVAVPHIHIEHPENIDFGDLASNVAMTYAKAVGMSPLALAEKIVHALVHHKNSAIEKVTIAGPGFINITLSRDYFRAELARIHTEGDAFGCNTTLSGKTWLIEHTSPNPNKAMHLGHLRNNVLGMAIASMASASGARVIRDAVDNDRGISIAKLMWGYLKFARKDGNEQTDIAYWVDHQDEWQEPIDRGMRPDRFVEQLYVKADADCESSAEAESRVRQLVIDWEAENKDVWTLWKKVLTYSHEGQQKTLQRLGSVWDHVWHEHEHYKEGKSLVAQGLAQGIFRIDPEKKYVLTDLAAYGLPDTVVQKSDGTALYITQDLALTKRKKEMFHPDRMFWVIGPDQTLAMQQLFAVSEQLGTGKREEFTHIPYGYMSVKDKGKMSSRAGTVVFIDELIDEVKEKADFLLQEKSAIIDADLAERVALGAVKFSILKTGRLSDIVFDPEASVSFEGDSGPYLQYSCARIGSLLRKGKEEGMNPCVSQSEPLMMVERLVVRYPEVVLRALADFAPHTVAEYLISLAREFNSLYGSAQKILDVAHRERSEHLLFVAQAVRIVIANGLRMLGIHVPEKM